MDIKDLVIYQKTYNNKAIFRFTKHTEHSRTEEYICTNEDGDMWLERIIIVDDVETDKRIFPLIKAAPTNE